jgi:hypothetical protein
MWERKWEYQATNAPRQTEREGRSSKWSMFTVNDCLKAHVNVRCEEKALPNVRVKITHVNELLVSL